MQNIYVYDPYGKVGKLIWYKGRAFYSYVVTYNHSYEFLYNGLIDGRAVINCIRGICSIKALYKSTVNGLTYEMKYKDKDLIWTKDPKNLKELIISRRFSK